MRTLPFLLLALLVAPMLVAQQDPCPPTFPPEACADDEVVGVTATPAPPVPLSTCEPCWDEADMVVLADGASCAAGINFQCTTNDPGLVSSMLIICDPGGGPPPSVMAILIMNSPAGECGLTVDAGGFYPTLSDVSGAYTDTEASCIQSFEDIDVLAGFDPCD